MDKTTTETPAGTGDSINGIAIDESGRALVADESQPETTGTPAETTEPQTTTTEAEPQVETQESTESFDEDTRSWAEKKGIDLNTPEGIQKAVNSYREAEKQLHKTSQERSELEKLVNNGGLNAEGTGDDSDLRTEVEQLKLQNQVTGFYMDNPDARNYDSKMAELVTDRPHLAGDLDALYALAKVKSGDIERQGGREALEKLADKQKAAVATGASTRPSSGQTQEITSGNVDQMVAQHDQKWFEANYEAINKAMEA